MDIGKDKAKEEKLLHDLEHILEHFDELGELDTDTVMPMTGGTSLENAERDDAVLDRFDEEASREQFPEHEAGFLKVPPVFSDES